MSDLAVQLRLWANRESTSGYVVAHADDLRQAAAIVAAAYRWHVADESGDLHAFTAAEGELHAVFHLQASSQPGSGA